MKRIFFLLTALLLTSVCVRAQDAATQEQLDKLRGEITALQASNVDLQKKLAESQKELQDVRDLAAKPTGNYASAEDAKRLAEAIKEVDRNRVHDHDLVVKELERLAEKITNSGGAKPTGHQKETDAGKTPNPPPQKGYEYVIQSGDTISAILAEYRKQGVKVSKDELLKANPGLKPESLKVGQKIFIPAPSK